MVRSCGNPARFTDTGIVLAHFRLSCGLAHCEMIYFFKHEAFMIIGSGLPSKAGTEQHIAACQKADEVHIRYQKSNEHSAEVATSNVLKA